MSILILAGDLTNYYLYKNLKRDGYPVKLEGFSHLTNKFPPNGIKISGYSTIIVPIPLTIDGSTLYSPYSEECIHIDQLFSKTDSDAKIIGGPFKIDDSRIYDLTQNRSFTDLTVIPTCEEIIKIIIDKSDATIAGANIGIIGDGRVSKKLHTLLGLLGANVKIITSVENSCDILIITSDNQLNDKSIEHIEDTLIIDITNRKYSKIATKKVLKARGLPSKSAPKSVADYIFKTLQTDGLI